MSRPPHDPDASLIMRVSRTVNEAAMLRWWLLALLMAIGGLWTLVAAADTGGRLVGLVVGLLGIGFLVVLAWSRPWQILARGGGPDSDEGPRSDRPWTRP